MGQLRLAARRRALSAARAGIRHRAHAHGGSRRARRRPLPRRRRLRGLAPNRPLRLIEGEVQRDALADYRLLADALADEFGLCIDAADLDAVLAVVAERAAA